MNFNVLLDLIGLFSEGRALSSNEFGILTDLLTKPCGIPWGCTADMAETGGGGPACGAAEGAWAPALCGASCGVVLWACCNPPPE